MHARWRGAGSGWLASIMRFLPHRLWSNEAVADDMKAAGEPWPGQQQKAFLSKVWPREPFDTLQRKRDAGPFSHMARN